MLVVVSVDFESGTSVSMSLISFRSFRQPSYCDSAVPTRRLDCPSTSTIKGAASAINDSESSPI